MVFLMPIRSHKTKRCGFSGKGSAIALLLLIVMSSTLVLAQTAAVELTFAGYGKTRQEVYVAIKNVGDVVITDVTLYVDGKGIRTIKGVSGPGVEFQEFLELKEGEHIIEVRTPEGAYDSIEVTASSQVSQTTTTTSTIPPSTGTSGFDYGLVIIGIVVILIIVAGLWLWQRREE